MKGDLPFVSVLMTSYNREKFIGEAIESVISSTYTFFELIIVDDCSNDGTVEIARSYGLKDQRIRIYVNNQNLGDYNNRNKAAEYARGKYIKYLDSDDIIYPDSLGIFVNGMECFPEAAVGIMSNVSQDDKPYPYLMLSREAYIYNFYKIGLFDTGPSALIFRADKFMEIGGFSGKRYVGDLEMNLRMAAKWPIVKMASSLIFWRQHEGQELFIGSTTTGYLEYQLPVLEHSFQQSDCPLKAKEKSDILKYFRKISAREVMKIALLKKAPGKALNIYKKLSLKTTDLLNAILFMKRKVN